MTNSKFSTPPPFTEGYMTRAQLAAYLGVSRATVTNLIKRRVIPAPVKMGTKMLRWKRSDVDRYLEEMSK